MNKPVVNLLCAFPYFNTEILRRLIEQPRENYRLIIDSGAFTAYSSGKPIVLDDYCKFLDSLEKLRPFHAVQLDVIGDHEATLKNYTTMRGRGYDVMPVFTRGSPIALMEELYTTTDYILIGGVAFGEGRRNYVKYLLPHLAGRKYHLLGFTDMNFIKTMKPYSVDSSGWESGGRYGRLYLYKGFGNFFQVGRDSFFPKFDSRLESYLRRMGLTGKEISLLGTDTAWAGGTPTLCASGTVRWLTGYAHVLMAADLETHIGTKSFLAFATANALEILLNARQLLEERKQSGHCI